MPEKLLDKVSRSHIKSSRCLLTNQPRGLVSIGKKNLLPESFPVLMDSALFGYYGLSFAVTMPWADKGLSNT